MLEDAVIHANMLKTPMFLTVGDFRTPGLTAKVQIQQPDIKYASKEKLATIS